MSAKHTPGPWVSRTERDRTIHIYGPDGRHGSFQILRMHGSTTCTPSFRDRIETDAARIVACVNACEGIEDPAALRGERDGFKANHDGACRTIAEMHAAAVGSVRGPIRGVVQDVADLRSKYDEAIEALKWIGSGGHYLGACIARANEVVGRPSAPDHGPHSGDGALAVQEVHEAPKAEQCTLCGQRDTGQTGEYPCVECGLPTDHDRPRCTGQHPNCLGCDALRRKRDLAKKPPGSCL